MHTHGSFLLPAELGVEPQSGAFFGEAEITGERSVCMQTQEPKLICSAMYMSNFSYAELERSKSCKCRRQLLDSPYCCPWILYERSDLGGYGASLAIIATNKLDC